MAAPKFPAALLDQWRRAKRGAGNPERQTNPVWQWLVEHPMSAYQAGEELGTGGHNDGARWCFERYGQSRTELPNGRVVFIAGEHEDHYDPDFFIYNDVVVIAPDSGIEIYGYSLQAFPPTDFHSATLVGDQIVLIGSLGYPADRKPGRTQVVTISCDDWRARVIETDGDGPGWLHEHRAQLSETRDTIVVSGGKVDRCDTQMLVENIDEWKLHLNEWRWERLTARQWPRFEMRRTDRKRMHLWDMNQVLFSQKYLKDAYEQELEKLTRELGGPPRLDLIGELFKPGVPHEALPQGEEEFRVFRIRVGDVTVRYIEDSFVLQATVEGELSHDAIESLRNDLQTKLEALERTDITVRTIE